MCYALAGVWKLFSIFATQFSCGAIFVSSFIVLWSRSFSEMITILVRRFAICFRLLSIYDAEYFALCLPNGSTCAAPTHRMSDNLRKWFWRRMFQIAEVALGERRGSFKLTVATISLRDNLGENWFSEERPKSNETTGFGSVQVRQSSRMRFVKMTRFSTRPLVGWPFVSNCHSM